MYLDYHWTAFHGDSIYADGSDLRPTPTAFPSNWTGLNSSSEVDRLKGKLLIIMGAPNAYTAARTIAFLKAGLEGPSANN